MVGLLQLPFVAVQLQPQALVLLHVHVNRDVDVVAVIALTPRRERTAKHNQPLQMHLQRDVTLVGHVDLVEEDAEVVSTGARRNEVRIDEGVPLVAGNFVEQDWLAELVQVVRAQRREGDAIF